MNQVRYTPPLSPLARAAYAAVCCMAALTGACRFSTNPDERAPGGELVGSRTDGPSADTTAAATNTPATAAAASEPASEATTASAMPQDSAQPGTEPPAAAASTSTTPMHPSAADPTATARDAAGSGAAAPGATATPDSSAADLADGGGLSNTQPAGETPCAAELASCLLRDPLGYAECLRMNAEHDCPEPDAGMAASSAITSETGEPLSQVCQAELASCIMRSPADADACTEQARTCKP